MILESHIILASLWLIGECCVISLWIIVDTRAKKRIFPSYTQVASVIVPCKGTDHGFHENIPAFLTQEYPRYQILFVVDSKDDPAYSALDQLTKNKPNAHLALVTPFSACSGKVAALLTGLASTADAEVLVFADSDMKPDTHWLQNLVAPLQDETIGATTGFRWYFPTNWKTLLISAWNMPRLSLLFIQPLGARGVGQLSCAHACADDRVRPRSRSVWPRSPRGRFWCRARAHLNEDR